MHYAIFKAERHDVMWDYTDNSWQVESYKKRMIENEIDCLNTNDYYRYDNNRYDWEHRMEMYGIRSHTVSSGECIVWEGEVNLERLRVSDNFYLPNFERHFEILKVETNAEGEIVYHVNYSKPFYENGEKSRLESIEEWIQNEFPETNIYSDLIEVMSFKEKWEKERNEFSDWRAKPINERREDLEKREFKDLLGVPFEIKETSSVINKTESFTYASDANKDVNFENNCIMVGVISVVLFGTLALLLML